MAEIASAYVSLVPSARGFGSSTERQLGPQLSKVGKRVGVGLGRSLFGAAAAIGVGLGATKLFADSIGEAREAQKVGALTTQVIKTTGRAANVTAKHVGKLSNAISKKAGIDDEAIQSGANLLLTFKNVRNETGEGNKVFDRATRAAVNLSAAGFGALSGTAKQMGKALNDPVKGITALGRAGVTFTAQQQEQIKKLVEGGNALKAQKIILREVESQVGGAAAATATAGDKAKVALGNLKESIGTALLPVIDNVANAFTNKIAPAITDVVDSIGPAAGKVRDFFTKGEGAGPLQAALDLIRDAADKIKDGFSKASDALGSMKDKADGFSLGNIDTEALGKSLGEALVNALGFLGEKAGEIADKISELFGSVDWVGIGISMGEQVPALLIGLAAGLLNFDFEGLLSGLADHWQQILIGILFLAFAPAKLIGPLTKVLTKIPFVGRFLAAAVTWISKLGSKLLGFGADLFRSFAKGFGRVRFPGSGIISKVIGALKGLPGRVKNFVDTLATRLGVWALDAFEAMGKGARKAVSKLVSFVGTIGSKVLKGIGKLGDLLKPVGEAIVNGLKNGISGAWHFVTDKVQELINKIPAKIRKLLGISSPSKVTRKLGEQTGQGLADGIDASGRAVGKAAGKLVKKLKAQLATLTQRLADLRSKAQEIASGITDAFRPDVFGGSLGDLVGGLAGGLANVQATLAAFPKLVAAGIGGNFLQQLLASGNASVITALAGNPAQAKALQAQFNQLQSLSAQLGTKAGAQATSADVASVTRELREIKRLLARAPKANGRETANALNHTAAASKRRRKAA